MSVLAGVLGCLKGIIHIPLIDDLKIVFFMYELKGISALIVGLILAVIFLGVGILCWKGTVGIIRLLHAQRWRLKYCDGNERQ